MLRLLALVLFAAAAPAAVIADQAMRYVNNEVITMGDVAMRNQLRLADQQRRGQVMPQTRDEIIAYSKQTLEDLTDEVLIAQEAKTLGMKNDHESLVRDVLEASRNAGAAFTLRDQADQRRLMERARTVESVLGFYEGRWPQPSPLALEQLYQKHRGEFNRPPRARTLQIVVHPSAPEQRLELRAAKNALLRRAQAIPGAVAEAAKVRLDEFLEAGPNEQEAVLDRLVADLAALAPAGADEATTAAIQEAARIAQRQATLRSPEEARRLLEVVRLSLAGRFGRDLEEGFREAARRLSQGPNAEQGGQLGWVEPGTWSKAFDDAVFNLPPGRVSQVFITGQAACLVLVAERIEARTRTFDEVSGELELVERRKRRQEVRSRLVQILRLQAMIRDVAGFDGERKKEEGGRRKE
jgi:parvulin-like peptidyl-prolyl isomerase